MGVTTNLIGCIICCNVSSVFKPSPFVDDLDIFLDTRDMLQPFVVLRAKGTSQLRVQHADTLWDFLQLQTQLMTQLAEIERRELNRGWGLQAINLDNISLFYQVSYARFLNCY